VRRELFSEEFDSIFNGITGSRKDGPEIVGLVDFSGHLAPIKKAAKVPGASANDLHGVSFLGKVYVYGP
jgi:hypothetical protein